MACRQTCEHGTVPAMEAQEHHDPGYDDWFDEPEPPTETQSGVNRGVYEEAEEVWVLPEDEGAGSPGADGSAAVADAQAGGHRIAGDHPPEGTHCAQLLAGQARRRLRPVDPERGGAIPDRAQPRRGRHRRSGDARRAAEGAVGLG